MLNRLKKTLQHSLLYSVSSIANKLVGFILLPIYTGNLTVTEYGIWGILEITIMILSQVLSLGQNQAFVRFYYTKDQTNDRKVLFSSQNWVIIGISVSLLILGQVFSPALARYFFQPEKFLTYFRLLFWVIALRLIGNFYLSVLRAKEQVDKYVLVNVVKFLLILIANILFLQIIKLKIVGILYAYIIGDAFLLLLTFLWMKSDLGKFLNFKLIKQTVQFGAPLILGSIAWMFLNMGDRYVLKILTNYHQVGLYSLGYKLSNLLNIIIIQPFSLGFLPLVYKYYQEKGDRRYYSKMFIYLSFVVAWVGIGLSLFGKQLIQIVARRPDYLSAWTIIPIISLAYYFWGASLIQYISFNLKNKTQISAAITITTAILNLLLNIIFIPLWGIIGAALATLFSFQFQFILAYILAQKTYPIPYEMKKFLSILLVWIGIYSLDVMMPISNLMVSLLVKFIFLSAFPFILYLIKFYEPVEIRTFKSFCVKIFKR